MSNKSIFARLRAAFRDGNEKELEAVMKDMTGEIAGEGQSDPVQVHVHNYGTAGTEKAVEAVENKDGVESEKAEGGTVEERLARLESLLENLVDRMAGDAGTKDTDVLEEENDLPLVEDEEKAEEPEKEKITKDADSVYADLVSRADILAPGFRVPRITKDAAADPKKTQDALCLCRRRVLDAAMKNETGRTAVKKFLTTRDGDTIEKMSCDRVDAVFVGASEVVKAQNNTKMISAGKATKDAAADPFKRGGLDQINANFWAKIGEK